MANIKQTKQYKALKKSLIENLTARGLTENVYMDMIERYMELWERGKQLKADIAENGVQFKDSNGCLRENRSVSLEIQTSREMLSIFTALGFKQIAANAEIATDIDDL